jgi:uncharacterized membrane protein
MRQVLAALLLSLLPLPAQATFIVCNRTERPMNVAIGLYNGTDWGSQGWWTAPTKKCVTLLPNKLNARFYYLYADDGTSGNWRGSRSFCVTSGLYFQIAGRADCAGRGYDRKSFFEVDTGQKLDYTEYLTD